jgi:hypothetical protein
VAALLALAALIAAGAPAHGQQPSVERQLLLANQDCTTQSGAPEVYSSASVATTCTSALAKLQAVAAVTSHDANVLHAMNVVARMAIATAYGTIDKARSRRSCDVAEQGWRDAAAINPQFSPAEIAGYLRDIIAKARAMVQICRNDFGAAPGTAPLN